MVVGGGVGGLVIEVERDLARGRCEAGLRRG